jgi:hypothetical protein
VHVRVEQSGQQGRPGAVDDLVAGQAGADLHDAAVLHEDVGGGRRAPGAVEDLATGEDASGHESASLALVSPMTRGALSLHALASSVMSAP